MNFDQFYKNLLADDFFLKNLTKIILTKKIKISFHELKTDTDKV